MKKLFILLPLFAILSLNAQVNVTLHMQQKLGDQPFEYGLPVLSDMGYYFMINRLEYYVSEIKLIHDGGQVTPVTDLYLLVDPAGKTIFELGSFPITDLEKIQFSVGVDSAHNHLDPSTYPSEHPLAHQDPSMHWGWFSGYRFIAVEGWAGMQPETLNNSFQIHTIADANYRTIVLDVEESVSGDEMKIFVAAEYKNLLQDIDVSEGMISHGANGAAKKIADNARDVVFSQGEITGTVDIQNLISVQFLPNPTNGQTVLSFKDVQVKDLTLTITDLHGSLVTTEVLSDSRTNHYIECNWAPGIYIANLYSDGKVVAVEKLVVK